MDSSGKKWFDNRILVHVLLILFFPVGLYALWRSRKIAKWWKVTVSLVFAFLLLPGFFTESTTNEDELELAQSRPELNQKELDSLEEVKRLLEIEERKKSAITATQLFKEYEGNEVLADRKYKDKYIYVQGTIDDIGKDILDDIYIVLKTGNLLFGVQCYIDDEVIVSQLRKGLRVTIYGKCDGKMGTIGLRDCSLIK